MTTMELIERGIGYNCLSDAYDLGKAEAYAEVDNLIAEMAEIAESQMMFRHAEICELIRERIKANTNE